ncbi:MAG: TldD/PmbA family protein [Candidatus Thorarchaeota archaeon]
MDTNIVAIIDSLMEKAFQLGVNEIEFYIQKQNSRTAFIESTKLKSATVNDTQGVGIRVIINKALGYASVNSFEKEKIMKGLEKAIDYAKLTSSEENYYLPTKTSLTKISDLYDPEEQNFGVKECIENAERILKNCKDYDQRINIESGLFTAITLENTILTSNGITAFDKKTGFQIELGGMAADGNTIGSWDEEYNTWVKIEDIDIEGLVKNFGAKLIQNLKAKKTQPFKGKAVISPSAARSLFSLIIESTLASTIHSGASFLKDKLGEKIADKKLTIIDNGTLTKSFASSTFDREGIPHKECKIFNKGVFQTVLHNAFTANKDKMKSTGHAYGDYRVLPEISVTNLEILPGKNSLEELISEIREGVLFNRISASPDPVSGEFAAVLKGGKIIQKGEVKETVKEITAVGNIFEGIKNIEGISKEQKNLNYYTSWKLPYIVLDNIQYIT